MTLEQLVKNYKELQDNAVIIGYRGSIAHGMYVPNTDPNSIDDVDLIAVSMGDIDHYFGFKPFGSRETKEIRQDPWDVVIYELRKFVGLLKNGNPNVLALLWNKPEHLIKVSSEGQTLINNRHLFLGKHIYTSFIGYAKGQMHKMTAFKFEGYMGDKRKKLVEKYGYDTKNAAHMIRLIRMLVEFLQTGDIVVYRPDAAELLEIKHGKWTLDQVKIEAERLFRNAAAVYNTCTLPEKPQIEVIDQLVVDMMKEHFNVK